MTKYFLNFRRVSNSTKEGIVIWYLLACQGQDEQNIAELCRKYLSQKALRKVFLLTYDTVRRYEGVWHLERKLLFPANVFLESEDEEMLWKELREYKELAGNENCLTRMNQEEEDFLKQLYGTGYHLKMSRGVISEGVAQIKEGPLKGMESRICKVDRHKRLARIRTGMKREYHYILAGLEITERII